MEDKESPVGPAPIDPGYVQWLERELEEFEQALAKTEQERDEYRRLWERAGR